MDKNRNKKIITKSAGETQELARDFTRKLLGEIEKRKQAMVIGLKGELGGGKTTFIQGMAQELGIKEQITSPTFVIFKKYQIPAFAGKMAFYHIDCYRLNSSKDILDLGFKEIISQPNLIAIEWAEKIEKILPKDVFWIRFEYIEDKREITGI